VAIERLAREGHAADAGADLLHLAGKARALLTAERPALNIVQHLSGIATLTRRYVDAIAGTGTILLDTRKTIPGLRFLEKYATRMGGAQNHRMGLWDAAMIKDNHVAVAGSVGEAVRRAVAAGIERIIVEVDRLEQIEPALQAGATHLLLDNMDVPTLREAVAIVAGRVPTEASGGVTLETIRAKAETGVTYISVGRITQSAPAADIGLDFASVSASRRSVTRPSMTGSSGWCLSSHFFTIRKFRVLERKKKSGMAPMKGIKPSSQSTPTLPAMRARCHFDMPRLRASQTSQAPIAAAAVSPTTGMRSRMTSRPIFRLVPGMVKARSSRCSIASSRWRTAAGSRPTGRRSASRSKRAWPLRACCVAIFSSSVRRT